MSFRSRPILLLAVLAILTACSGAKPGDVPSTVSAAGLLGRITDLSADSMEGRGPGTRAEAKVVAYLTAQFRAIGAEPGNPDGSWTQPVELVGFTAMPTMEFHAGGKTIPMTFRDDYVAASRREVPNVEVVNSDIVFVGYGIEAPEYQWDDFKRVDVKGKTIVILVNDPPVPDATDSTKLDAAMFRGTAMTYYGRWTYKFEEASRRGAAAAILVHQTVPAGYPWSVVSGSWSGENMDVKHADGNAERVAIESWITYDKAKQLFAAAGKDFDALARSARARDFTPVRLGATATIHLKNAVRAVHTRNVIAKLTGSDPALKQEYVVYTAHWDHLGIGQPVNGDSIYNGAVDNAAGTAALLELAKAFKALSPAPRRTILFLIVTAEEKGLLGARFYAENPLYPLAKTLADFNLDGVNQWGRTTDLVVIGMGATTLEDVLDSVATARGRTLSPDPESEKGFYYRSDHFEFAKQGVPAMFLDNGVNYIGKPAGYGKQKRDEYTANDYHKPSDEVKKDWDLSGAVEDLDLLFNVGIRVANTTVWPAWKPGTEFKAIREQMLQRTP